MPSIAETLRTALASDAVLTSIIGDRLFPGQVPDDETPLDWLYYAFPETTPFDCLDDEADDQIDVTCEVEFHALAARYANAKMIIDAVRLVLNTYRGGGISRAFWTGTSEETTEDGYHHVARFKVWGKLA